MDLILVDEIGEKIAQSVIEFFDNQENKAIIERLKQYGVQLETSAEQDTTVSDKLAGKTFVVSGIFEMLLGLGILFKKYSKMAAWGIIVLLLLFIPSHIYFIQIGACVENGLCVPKWVAWIRLLLIHPILIFWAYIFTKNKAYGK